MKIVSMKLTPKELQAQAAPAEAYAPEYPYGLQLIIQGEQLKSLGLESPAVGQTLRLVCIAEVTSVSMHENSTSSNLEVGVQIKEMGAEEEAADKRERYAKTFK